MKNVLLLMVMALWLSGCFSMRLARQMSDHKAVTVEYGLMAPKRALDTPRVVLATPIVDARGAMLGAWSVKMCDICYSNLYLGADSAYLEEQIPKGQRRIRLGNDTLLLSYAKSDADSLSINEEPAGGMEQAMLVLDSSSGTGYLSLSGKQNKRVPLAANFGVLQDAIHCLPGDGHGRSRKLKAVSFSYDDSETTCQIYRLDRISEIPLYLVVDSGRQQAELSSYVPPFAHCQRGKPLRLLLTSANDVFRGDSALPIQVSRDGNDSLLATLALEKRSVGAYEEKRIVGGDLYWPYANGIAKQMPLKINISRGAGMEGGVGPLAYLAYAYTVPLDVLTAPLQLVWILGTTIIFGGYSPELIYAW